MEAQETVDLDLEVVITEDDAEEFMRRERTDTGH
jgi:hypothetical protein